MFDIVIPCITRSVSSAPRWSSSSRPKRVAPVHCRDGSGDEGPLIVERYHDERIQLMRQANQGVGPARNRAMRQGSADWIALLNPDDIWNVDHLEELDAIRQAFPQTVLIEAVTSRLKGMHFRDLVVVGGDGGVFRVISPKSAHGRQPFIVALSVAVRRSAIAEVGSSSLCQGTRTWSSPGTAGIDGPVASSTKSACAYRIDTAVTDLENRKCPTSTQRPST